jgi:sodium-dependent dicarboxylate transporter 2/3/5
MSGLSDLSWPLLILALMAIIVYLGELASNTAVAAIFLPVAGALAIGMGATPLALMLPAALAASLGFMLPVATPPNAIAYGSGSVSPQQMLRAGAVLDVISIAIVAAIAMILGPRIFG